MKNIIIYFLFFLIILLSFKFPETFLKIEEKNIGDSLYKKDKDQNMIDIEAEKIYLVKAIHDISNEYSSVAISTKESEIEDTIMIENENSEILMKSMYKELLKLQEYDILKKLDFGNQRNCKREVIEKYYYNQEENKYIVDNMTLKFENNQFILDIEKKTGKIIKITVPKENLNNISKEKIMKNYINYLDLYIIDDWVYQDEMVKSNKSKLYINLIETEENYILSINSINKMFNIYEFNDDKKNLYKIDAN